MSSKNKKHKFSVRILGEEQLIVGDVSEDYVKKLANYINKVGTEITKAYPRLPRRRLLGLTMINMADEFYKFKNDIDQKNEKIKDLKSKNYDLREENEKLKEKVNDLEKELEASNKEKEELLALLEEVE
ncbi:MAG: cell division protein ZapA [Bacillota bacterium]